MLRSLLCLILGHNRRYRFNDHGSLGEFHSCERCGRWYLTTDGGTTFEPCQNPHTRTPQDIQ